jgi:hypothetical protein
MAAPLVGIGLKVATAIAAKKAGTAAGKQVIKAIKGKKAGEAYATAAKKKAANKAADAAAIKKAKNAKPSAAPKSNVTVKKASSSTDSTLNRIRTLEGTTRQSAALKKAEEIRKAKAAQRMLEIKNNTKFK